MVNNKIQEKKQPINIKITYNEYMAQIIEEWVSSIE